MKHGFIKVAAITPQISVADTALNAENIICCIKRAEAENASIAVLPELCITGSTCRDMFLSDTLLQNALSCLSHIAAETATLDVIAVVGLPVKFDYKVYNCAAVIHSGEILGIVPKSNLTNNESRYFASADTLADAYNTIKIGDDLAPLSKNLVFRHSELDFFRFGVQIGSDLFAINNTADELTSAGATIILNCAAIPYTPENEGQIHLLSAAQSLRLSCGYALCNSGYGESTTDNVFAGGGIIAENGEIIVSNSSFENDILISEIDIDKMVKLRKDKSFPKRPENFTDILFWSDIKETVLSRRLDRSPFEKDLNREIFYEKTLTAAAYGLKKRVEHTSTKKLVLGISGGLDSTLALLTCVRTVKLCNKATTDIIAVTMPCFGTSNRTKSNAEKLCEAIGVTLKTVDIKKSVSQHFEDIGHSEENRNVTFENAQARERTQILMDIANDVGGMVIGTGDLSELALGFATYNGDQMSMYGVNATIPKTFIRSLTKYEAENYGGEIGEILLDIVNTPVSPELLPPEENGNIAQVTEELVGPYELHDFFIYNLVKNGFSPKKVYYLATKAFEGDYTPETILKWLKVFLRRFLSQQFKRSCMPDGVQVTDVSFSPRGSFAMPSDITAKIWLNDLENL